MKKWLLVFVRKYWQFLTFVAVFTTMSLLSIIFHSDGFMALPVLLPLALLFPTFIISFIYFVFYKGLKDLDSDAEKVTQRIRIQFFLKFVGCWFVLGIQVEYFTNIRDGFAINLLIVDQIAVLMYLFIGMFFVKLIQVGKQNYGSGDGLYWVMFPIWYSMAVMYPMLFLRWLFETFFN